MKIDAHHHFWNYSETAYPWMKDPLGPLRRDYLPQDLKAEIDTAGIDGVVSVQVRQELKENDYFLGFSDEHNFIKGVVGWAPLTESGVADALAPYLGHPKFVGVRHIIQDEPDDDYILREDFNRGISEFTQTGLVYDILIYEKHLRQTVEFVDRHPNQVFVLDHIAKPKIGENLMDPWKTYMQQLAERENVYCKVSGMATEAVWDSWTDEQLLPYIEHSIECFGPQRIMFGSDWPVAVLAIEYTRWTDLCKKFFATFSADEQARIWGGTAIEAYKLKV